MATRSQEAKDYYPTPESSGGWRWAKTDDEVRSLTEMDPDKLDQVETRQNWHYGNESWSIVIIRNGYIAREYHTWNVLFPTRFDTWSVTKSFTGTAWGLLLDDSRQGKLPNSQQVDLDSPAYAFIPEGEPLTDPSKADITFRHLLSMTSGIPGSSAGVHGIPTSAGYGAFEHVLGHCPKRYGNWPNKLTAKPGTHWDYSDPAFAHLALSFAHIMEQEMSEYLQTRIFAPISIENLSWDVQGGNGFIGPHTNAHTGVHISARELARLAYLMLRGGIWDGQRLLPEWWIELTLRPSQDLNPSYGYTWHINTDGKRWPYLPKDTFAMVGARSNICCIIPSLDLIISRVGSGPSAWNEKILLAEIAAAIITD